MSTNKGRKEGEESKEGKGRERKGGRKEGEGGKEGRKDIKQTAPYPKLDPTTN